MHILTSKIPHEIMGINYTNTERTIMELMSDGQPRQILELGIWDDQADANAIRGHIHQIRKKIEVSHYRIHSGTEKRQLVYRLVRILN